MHDIVKDDRECIYNSVDHFWMERSRSISIQKKAKLSEGIKQANNKDRMIKQMQE
jgi:hypothetical protein